MVFSLLGGGVGGSMGGPDGVFGVLNKEVGCPISEWVLIGVEGTSTEVDGLEVDGLILDVMRFKKEGVLVVVKPPSLVT